MSIGYIFQNNDLQPDGSYNVPYTEAFNIMELVNSEEEIKYNNQVDPGDNVDSTIVEKNFRDEYRKVYNFITDILNNRPVGFYNVVMFYKPREEGFNFGFRKGSRRARAKGNKSKRRSRKAKKGSRKNSRRGKYRRSYRSGGRRKNTSRRKSKSRSRSKRRSRKSR